MNPCKLLLFALALACCLLHCERSGRARGGLERLERARDGVGLDQPFFCTDDQVEGRKKWQKRVGDSETEQFLAGREAGNESSCNFFVTASEAVAGASGALAGASGSLAGASDALAGSSEALAGASGSFSGGERLVRCSSCWQIGYLVTFDELAVAPICDSVRS
jgi:hypothetical protein